MALIDAVQSSTHLCSVCDQRGILRGCDRSCVAGPHDVQVIQQKPAQPHASVLGTPCDGLRPTVLKILLVLGVPMQQASLQRRTSSPTHFSLLPCSARAHAAVAGMACNARMEGKAPESGASVGHDTTRPYGSLLTIRLETARTCRSLGLQRTG